MSLHLPNHQSLMSFLSSRFLLLFSLPLFFHQCFICENPWLFLYLLCVLRGFLSSAPFVRGAPISTIVYISCSFMFAPFNAFLSILPSGAYMGEDTRTRTNTNDKAFIYFFILYTFVKQSVNTEMTVSIEL